MDKTGRVRKLSRFSHKRVQRANAPAWARSSPSSTNIL